MNSNKIIPPLVIIGVLALGGFAFLALQLKPADEEAEEKIITDVGVHVTPITKSSVQRTVVAQGIVDAEPASGERPAARVQLSAPTVGLIQRVACSEGQPVSAGALLVELDERNISAQRITATTALAFATKDHQRTEQMLKAGLASPQALQDSEKVLTAAKENVSAIEAQAGLLQIHAPFAGIVSRMDARVGEMADPTRILVEIIDPNRVLVNAAIPAAEAAAIHPGQSAHIRVGNNTLAGQIRMVSPQVDLRNGTVLVRIDVPHSDLLIPGYVVEVLVVVEEQHDQLVTPVKSLVRRNSDSWMVGLVDGDKAHLQVVTLGIRDQDKVAITGDGVKEGALVVTDEIYGLPDETRIHLLGQ